MISLRLQLLFWISLVLVLVTAVLASVIYDISDEELNDMLDESMLQVAYVVAAQQDARQHDTTAPLYEQHDLGEDGDFLIQVWSKNGELLYTSHKDLELPLINDKGFGYTDYDDERWRYYIKPSKDRTIQLFGTMEEREEDIMEIVLTFLYPVLMQLPLVLVLAFFAIGRGLKPLRLVSDSIEKKDSRNLSPIGMKKVPREIRTVVSSLNLLLEKLDDALKVQRQFTADAAHELRTPLAAVQIHIDNLERAQSDVDRKESLDFVKAAVKRCTRMVRSLLTLSRQEPEVGTLSKDRIDLNRLARQVSEDYLPFAKEKGITLNLATGDGDMYIIGEEQGLSIMIGNLLHNAVLYTPENGHVDVSVSEDDAFVVLTVKDDGRGIPEEHRDRIFDRFYRVLGTKTTGSGLGLSIVKAIAQNHGASITVGENEDGKGTRFDVVFPAASTDLRQT